MYTESAKLVLSGGNGRRPFFEAIFELCGTDQPRCVIDLSAKTNNDTYTEARKSWSWALDKHGVPPAEWLQTDFTSDPDVTITNKLLERADVLLVAGGSTRRAYKQWQKSGILEPITMAVSSGSVVAAGGSAGAMIWFENGYSDSDQFEVADGEVWDYSLVEGANMIDGWVTAHHSDIDGFGRLRSVGFAKSLSSHQGEWRRAFGIDTNAALVCHNGLMRAIDLSSQESSGPHDVYMYIPNSSEPVILPNS